METLHNITGIPEQYELIAANVKHPCSPDMFTERGDLVSVRATGMYAFLSCGILRTIDQRMAREIHHEALS